MSARQSVPWQLVPTFAFEAQHDYIDSVPADELKSAIDGIGSDFAGVLFNRTQIASDLLTVLEAVAAGDCIGCKDVACRIVMMIEDLKDELGID
jgi:hypothetical protein